MARGLPGDPIRWDDEEPHLSDTQAALAMYDPRTVTTHSQKDRIHPLIPRGRGLKETTTRLLTPALAAAEAGLHARFRDLAPRKGMAKRDLLAWGFANISTDDPAFLLYAGLDPLCTIRLFELMREQLTADGKWPRTLAALREQWMVDRATYVGMQVDGPYAEWLDGELARVIEENAAVLAPYEIKPSGLGPSVGAAFHSLGVAESPIVDQDGKEKWNKEAMSVLLAKCDEIYQDPQYAVTGVPDTVMRVRQLAEAVMNVRKAGKYRSNWVAPMLWTVQHADGAMHPSMRAYGTVTSRMGCQKTQTAGPLHSLPKSDTRLRAAVRARRGWVIVSADFKQAEPTIMGALSGDQDYLADLQAGDINSVLASQVFGKAYDPTNGKTPGTVHYKMRQSCKFAWLAWCYGAAEGKVDSLLGVHTGVVGIWRSRYPTFAQHRDEMNRQKIIELDSGVRVPLWDRYWVDGTGVLQLRTWEDGRPKTSRLGLNAETQGTQADLLKYAMHRINAWGWSWALRFFVHDETIMEVPAWMASAAKLMLEAAMTITYRGVTIQCDADIEGRTWQPQPTEFRASDIEEVDDDA
jgi:hypothetical protein